MIHVEFMVIGPVSTNCYFLVNDELKEVAIVDPGDQADRIKAYITKEGLKPVAILLTHGHFDHIYGAADFAKTYNVPIYMDPKETYSFEHTNPYVCGCYGLQLPELPESFTPIKDGDIIEVGSLRLEVLQTPGHSVGGVCYLERNENILFSGDTLFAGAIGRTDHPGGDYDVMMKSIWEKIMCLEGNIEVLPGHGPTSEIARERMTNPFLLPFNEPYEE